MSQKSSSDTGSLQDTLKSSFDLLTRFLQTLQQNTTTETVKEIQDPPEPLDVLHTAATLLKAHVTRLSLLLINKPFTPSAVRKVINDIASTCLPAMMSAVELCIPERYSRLLYREVGYRVRKVFSEFKTLLEETQELSRGLEATNETKIAGKDVLTCTGVLFEACDSLIMLKDGGVVGLVVQRTNEHRALLDDALSELKGWGEKEPGEDEDDDLEGSESDGWMEAPGGIPKGDIELKQTLDLALKRIKLVSTLYQALIKRRFSSLDASSWVVASSVAGSSPAIAQKVDHIMDVLHQIPERVDDIASAFYDLNKEEAHELLIGICDLGRDVVKLTSTDWSGREDEFTTWSNKWLEAIENKV